MLILKRLLPLILLLFCSNVVFAQQSIITVPSSDVLPTGHLILKESNKASPFGDVGNYQITPTMTFGTGWGTETSVGVATGITPYDRTSLKIDIAAKKVFFLGSKTRFTIGGRVSPYLNMGRTPDSFIFAHASYRIRKTKTAITSGMYMAGRNQAPNQTGFLIGVDQVIIPNKLRLVGEYLTGDNNWSNFSVGLKYRPVSDLSITTAVIIPNNSVDNNVTFLLSFSKYFGDIKNIHDKIKPQDDKNLKKEEKL